MIEIVIVGRGGQGAVTATEILSIACFNAGYYVQSFPKFGPERRGAPVEAYCRISKDKILLRSQVYEPDFLVIFDEKLIDLWKHAKSIFLVNTSRVVNGFCINATNIAIKYLGVPIVNTAMLGAMIKVLDKEFDIKIPLHTLKNAISLKFKDKAEKNIRAMEEAYREVKRC